MPKPYILYSIGYYMLTPLDKKVCRNSQFTSFSKYEIISILLSTFPGQLDQVLWDVRSKVLQF